MMTTMMVFHHVIIAAIFFLLSDLVIREIVDLVAGRRSVSAMSFVVCRPVYSGSSARWRSRSRTGAQKGSATRSPKSGADRGGRGVAAGRQINAERKFLPGYVLSRWMNDESWHLVKKPPKVTGFLGAKGKPAPIPESEIITCRPGQGRHRATEAAIIFEIGEQVRVSDGRSRRSRCRRGGRGKGPLKVAVSIFGRATPVELEYTQVEKI